MLFFWWQLLFLGPLLVGDAQVTAAKAIVAAGGRLVEQGTECAKTCLNRTIQRELMGLCERIPTIGTTDIDWNTDLCKGIDGIPSHQTYDFSMLSLTSCRSANRKELKVCLSHF